MKELKILYLYPDMLELYGDYGNIQVLKYRLEKRGLKAIIDSYSIGDLAPDFTQYDLVFAGGGADQEQSILANDLLQYKDNIQKAIDSGVFFLLICGSYQLFGKYYKGVEGNIIDGLGVFDYYTEAINDRKKRCIGNIVVDVNLNGHKTQVIGFENHGGQTFGPLLSKNPELADYIIKYCLDRKYNDDTQLSELDDTFENLCRKQLLEKFISI